MLIASNSSIRFCSRCVIRTSLSHAQIRAVEIYEVDNLFCKGLPKEALWLGSREFHSELNQISSKAQFKQKLIQTVLKYYQRITHRCTPFGLFAGCTSASWSNKNQLQISNLMSRSTRLDMHFMVALARHLEGLECIKSNLVFFPNTSVSAIYDKLRYTEYFYKDKKRIHQLAEVDGSVYLHMILTAAEQGKYLHDLAQEIVSEEISIIDASAFVEELVQSQLLVSELEPGVSGNGLLSRLIFILERVERDAHSIEISEILNVLRSVNNAICDLDAALENEPDRYEAIAEKLRYFPVECDLSKLFQVDLFWEQDSKESSLDIVIQHRLQNAMRSLHHLCGKKVETNLDRFHNAFYAKYEDRPVRLLEALDNEAGVGYGQHLKTTSHTNELVQNLIVGKGPVNQKLNWDSTDQFLFHKLISAVSNDVMEVRFIVSDFDVFGDPDVSISDSYAIMFSLLDRESKAILFKSAWGPSAAGILGRFGSGNEKIGEIVKEITEHEEELNPGKIHAEIIHLPEKRIGNVLMRPSVRKYEIPYLSGFGVRHENQVRLQDLYICVRNNRIVLWSEKLQKEVLPRMANAHNYAVNALPVYHFLCDMQSAGTVPGLSFNWGSFQDQFIFLPRAVIEDVIVFPATWQFKKSDFDHLLKTNYDAKVDMLFEWKAKWRIPDRFYIADGDNELVIHLHRDEELLISLFLSELKKRQSIILKEFLFDLENPAVTNQKGEGFTNEFIAPVVRICKEKVQPVHVNLSSFRRTFVPGSEWIYYKIYAGIKTSERILLEVLEPLCNELLEKNLIDKWFFILYTDPDHHIRIRFHSTDESSRAEVQCLFYHAFKESCFGEDAFKIQADTYQREIERYGEATMELSETLFFEDSTTQLSLIRWIIANGYDEQRWILAIRLLNDFLDAFGLNAGEKIAFCEKQSESYHIEFGFTGKGKVQIDQKYRKLKKQLEDSFKPGFYQQEELVQIFQERNEKFQGLALQIKGKAFLNSYGPTMTDLMGSYFHMTMNRFFRSNQRMAEMMIYDFLHRRMVSEKARTKRSERE
jgi:lantibiotic biosynthesis protein